MKFHVKCPHCSLDVWTRSEVEATELRRRHHGLVGHRPDITPLYETPCEGWMGGVC